MIHRLSPCKINLLLNILGKREDGFHDPAPPPDGSTASPLPHSDRPRCHRPNQNRIDSEHPHPPFWPARPTIPVALWANRGIFHTRSHLSGGAGSNPIDQAMWSIHLAMNLSCGRYEAGFSRGVQSLFKEFAGRWNQRPQGAQGFIDRVNRPAILLSD